MDYSTDLIIYPRQNRDILLNPWRMGNNRDLDRGEEIFAEMPMFRIITGEAFIL